MLPANEDLDVLPSMGEIVVLRVSSDRDRARVIARVYSCCACEHHITLGLFRKPSALITSAVDGAHRIQLQPTFNDNDVVNQAIVCCVSQVVIDESVDGQTAVLATSLATAGFCVTTVMVGGTDEEAKRLLDRPGHPVRIVDRLTRRVP